MFHAQIALGNMISLPCFSFKVRYSKVIYILLPYVVHPTELLLLSSY